MFDDEMNIYLIEINASPAMDYSTKITERLVKEMPNPQSPIPNPNLKLFNL